VIVYYPSGEDALYNFPYLFGCGLVALLAAISLVYPDPLHLGRGRAKEGSPPASVDPADTDRASADPTPADTLSAGAASRAG
jgi:alpha-1,6-mannosyltransferase